LTNWPPLLTGVQEFFENLANSIWKAAWTVIGTYWTYYIWPAIAGIGTAITNLGDWLWDKVKAPLDSISSAIQGVINGVVSFVSASSSTIISTLSSSFSAAVNSIWTSINSAISSLSSTVSGGLIGLSSLLTATGDWLLTNIRGALDTFTASISNGITSIGNTVSGGLNALGKSLSDGFAGVKSYFDATLKPTIAGLPQIFVDALSTLFDTLLTSMGALKVEHSPAVYIYTPAPHNELWFFAGWIRDGISAFWDTLVKGVTWLGEQIWGAINVLIDRLSDAATTLFRRLTDTITQAITPGSPPKEISTASTVVSQTVWNKQLEIIDKAYHSPPTNEGIIQAGTALTAGLISSGILAMVLSTVADVVHPFKDIGIKVTARELIYWVGIPSVTAAIMVLPTQIGVLTPMRYALYERWQPLQPEAPDLIRMAVREAFIPSELERLKVPGPGPDYYTYMHRLGYNDEWADRWWASHWVRPPIEQLNEALYRNIIDSDTWTKEVRLNDYAPYAIPWLQNIIYQPYTRVDIRRMWDMRVVDEDEVYTNYKWLGYDDEHAKRMTLWTKIYTMESELRSRYSKGWIDEAQVRSELLNAGMPESRVSEWVEKIVKVDKTDRMADERDLTKTDILRLLKVNSLTSSQAMDMLKAIGYDDVEAGYLVNLALYQPEIELKELTQAQILKAYTLQVYSRDEAKNKLIEYGYSESTAETLLKLEDIKLEDAKVVKAAERDLSRTDIINGIKRKLIDTATGYNYLSYMGYSDWEIKFIFNLEGVEAAPPVEVLPEQVNAEIAVRIAVEWREFINPMIAWYKQAGYDTAEAEERYNAGDYSLGQAQDYYSKQAWVDASNFARDARSLYLECRSRLLSAKKLPVTAGA